MPGSGKSTVGKLLAKQLHCPFLDLDSVIEKHEGATVKAIFELKGEDYFRQLEAAKLQELATNKPAIIATGGGTPCHYNGIDIMNKTGITVFLDIAPEALIQRIEKEKTRPLLLQNATTNLQELYAQRIAIYQQAHIRIEADQCNAQELTTKIMATLTANT